MEPRDWIASAALFVSLGSLTVALFALVRTNRHNRVLRRHNKMIRRYASAAPDIQLAGQINQHRQTITDIALKMIEIRKGKPPDKLTDKERQLVLEMQPIYQQAVEALHTSYDVACRLYRDGCVDRDRFRRQYETHIRKLFEEGTPEDKERLGGITTPYQALRSVYEEWFHKEK